MNSHPKIENLKPFLPGQTGNPNGRPKKLPDIELLLLEAMGEEGEEALAIIEALINKAKKGDVRAAEVLLDRAYGKVRQDIKGDINHNFQRMVVHVVHSREEARAITADSNTNLREES